MDRDGNALQPGSRRFSRGGRATLGLLGRARSMMQGWSASPSGKAQPFSVRCAEGHRLQGLRTEGYQALRCPTCGEGIFVLPRSPLPEPSAPTSATRSRLTPAAAEASFEEDALVLTDPIPSSVRVDGDEQPEAEIDWVDEADEAAVPPPTPSPRTKPKPVATPAPFKAPASKAPRVAPPPAMIAVERPTLREWASRHRHALMIAGFLLLIVGTVSIRQRRLRLEDLPRVAELGRTEGLRKLDLGEFHAAKKLLSDAADAVDGLGGRFEGADEIRQGAKEAAIFADLASKGFDEILEEAATSDPKEWPSRFATMYRGRSVLLDAPITATPDPAQPGSSYQVDCPIYFGRGPKYDGKGRLDLAGFRLFELAQPKVGEQKPFGARYRSVELDATSNDWVITLEPDSGVFITHPDALRSIHWGGDEPAEDSRP